MRALVFLALAACTGEISSPGSGDPAPDAATTSPSPSPGPGSGSASGSGSGSGSGSASACKTLVASASLTSGHHNAGQDCLNCHNGATAPVFTLGGTLYDSAGSALAGGTITVVDASGASVDVVSQLNGNFYTSQAFTFPVTVTASACPTTLPMTSKVSAGGCATGGCHVSGAQGPIHL